MMLRMLSNWAKTHISGAKTSLKRSVKLSLLSMVVVTFVAGISVSAQARSFFTDDTLTTVSVTELPKQGQQVYALISQGGPFAYDKDGVVFGNREQQLPKHKRGYYREYTVKTSGVRNRGAKRIVCGGLQVQSPDVCYYTEDHYSSFRKIVR
ncbi:MAG: ribonuclease [Burkholderiaceae bacterium]